MKKILSLILAGLMTVSCAAFVAADDAAVEATSDPAQDYAISFLETLGIYKGGEGLTNEDDIQRYQMALFVSRISTGWVEDKTWEDGTANDSKFDDINDEPANKYLGALSYANQNGIIEGYSATKFAPYDNITYRDALTMVVRTLGYKGLSYPWGNIEKAVELGLTEGVDAAYTDELTRGEVALIIYNALFAETDKGGTLAKAIFDVDFAWENIIIVSTDEYTLVENADGSKAYAPAAKDKETYVGFKTIDEDGTIGEKVYYVKAKELGLAGHEEEVAVGSIYVALFEEAGKDNFVTIKKADKGLITKTVANDGITDNEGKAYETMPIAAELKNYQLVKNYTNGVVSYEYDDLKIYGYGTYTTYGKNDELVGIQFDTNDIVKKVTKADGTTEWVTAWFYNAELQKYYEYEVVDDKVYVNWMSEPEFIEWYNEAIKVKLNDYFELKLLDAGVVDGKAPYAKLDLYNIDAEADYEIANYKSYQIGQISLNTTDYKCAACDAVKPAYVLQGLDGAGKDWVFVEEGHKPEHDSLTKGFGWLNVAEDVTTFDPAVGGVVLYNWNKTTGEIEIVKHITTGENDDADSKIITGILQAYSTNGKTVTIDGTVYPIDYDNLVGDIYAMADTKLPARKKIADLLDDQYMQYVTAVICDGYVVDTDLKGAEADFIVSLGYAGVTADGYIAVYGYKTSDLALSIFKINSFNGWKRGDYRYNPANAEKDDAFDFGALYEIRSFDSETNSYGVYTENVSNVLDGATPVMISFENGYRVVQPAVIKVDTLGNNGSDKYYMEPKKDDDDKVVAPTIYKMTAADKYVIIDEDSAYSANSNIHVYDGIVNEHFNYTFNGFLVKGAANSSTVVLYTNKDMNNWNGFRENSYDIGYILYDGASVLEAAYDDAVIESIELLGASVVSTDVFNLLTGKYEYVIASNNIDLIEGHIYKTIGNQILWDITDECRDADFWEMIEDAYDAYDLDYADYKVASFDLRKEWLTKKVDETDVDITKVALAAKMGLVSGLYADYDKYKDASAAKTAVANEVVDEIRVWKVTTDESFKWYGDCDETVDMVAMTLADLAAKTTYNVRYVYEVATEDVVLYIYDNEDDIKEDEVPEVEEPNPVKTITNDGEGDNADPLYFDIATIKDRDFEMSAVYTVSAEFDKDDCQGDIVKNGFKLNALELSIVEKIETASRRGTKITHEDLKDCDTDSAMHNALAHNGVGLGAQYVKENIEIRINDVVLTDKQFTAVESYLDCGLANKLVITFKDVVLDAAATNENTILVVVDGKTVGTFVLRADYIEVDDDKVAHGSMFDGVSTRDFKAETLGYELNLNAKAPEPEKKPVDKNADDIIILGE